MRRAHALLLVAGAAAAQQTITPPGTSAPNATAVQGVTGGVPIPVSGSLSSSGAADTIGSTVSFNANSICAVVALAGQLGAGFFLGAGTDVATFTPSLSEDATLPSCSGGNWTPSAFVDTSGNATSSVSVTNPNGFLQYGIKTLAGSRCARVCTTAWTSGTADGFVVATTVPSPPPAAGADVTDRAGRLLGHVAVDSAPTTAVTASSLPLPAGASTSALQTTLSGQLPAALDGSGNLKTHEQGTAPVSAVSLPLPTGASTETTLGLIKTDVDKIPTSPATDRATAAAPFSVRLSTGAAFIDPTQIRALTVADVVTVAQGAAGAAAWKVDGTGGTFPVTGTFWQSTQPVSLAAGVDVTDRAARLLGVTYGSQGQQLKQTATNFNLQSELAVGGTLIDPRAIRALTVADVIGIGAGSAIIGKVGIDQTTPGTTDHVSAVLLPGSAVIGHVVADTGSTTAVTQATGTNLHAVLDSTSTTAVTQPTAANLNATAAQGAPNSTANAWPAKITDGTNVGAVKAASTAAVATDPAQVVAVSPNNSVAVTGAFFQATQPVSATSLPLPSGASTAANQTSVQTLNNGAIPANVNVEAGSDYGATCVGGPCASIPRYDNQGTGFTNVANTVSVAMVRPMNSLLQRCNAVRRTNCQP